MILFLNKTDIFKKKIAAYPISKNFPDYKGMDDDFESASEFFLRRFLKANHSETKQVYSHFTCATDPTNMLVVIRAVNEFIVRNTLQSIGLV
jgi:guanine nucleotide-binding protein subunit alpha